MAKIVITDAVTKLDSVGYDAQIKTVTLTFDSPEVTTTNMLSLGWKEILGGIKSFTVGIEFVQDSDLSGLDAALFTALGTIISWETQHTTGVVAPAIPKYSGSLLVNSWGLNLTLGEALGMSVTFPGTGIPTRATS